MSDALRAETVTITGHNDDEIEAYLARPLDAAPFGGVVVIHHMPGYDEATKEMVRTFAANGYAALCPNLYSRVAPGASPDDAAAAARAQGGVADEQVVGDVDGAAKYLRALEGANGKIGVIGHCSGGRQTFLAASQPADRRRSRLLRRRGRARHAQGLPGQHARADGPRAATCPARCWACSAPRTSSPTPEEVKILDEELTKLGKEHEFHSYEGAGHAFFSVDRPSYRVEAAVDGWQKIFAFYGKHLAG